jgi:hypothetical protein
MTDDLSARLQIMETVNRYAWSYDTRDLDLMGNCFAEQGVFEVLLEGHDGWGPYQGREAIVTWLSSVMESQHDQRRHCVTNVIFRAMGPTSALVESYLLLTAVEQGNLRVVCTGTYHDEMVKENGAWLIRRKTLRLDNPF